jgi:hypothetical protein
MLGQDEMFPVNIGAARSRIIECKVGVGVILSEQREMLCENIDMARKASAGEESALLSYIT